MITSKKELEALKKGIKHAFNGIKAEFNEHLDTINQNTTEITSLYDYVAEVEHKIDKLTERLDELQMSINPDMTHEKFDIELTHREQETFMVLYSQQEKITAKKIARVLGFTDEMVNRYVYNLITKGVPIIKQFNGEEVFLLLDGRFKDLQARKNVLKIDQSISRQLLDEEML